ncbi:unnamed protein product [Ceutorhynchus assimilis]|uniref:NADH dehydrogenase [ubiquinone] 1 beta subcomplex subunit 6 n=1 Tax=Ceutorhynchus assimilis TaxID=467358 RepID=A0A9N9MYS1_9CUCU|nr:unnamed protein product [Ceutorhynchus assimilis]
MKHTFAEKASDTGGVKPMSIEGRLNTERERLFEMSDEERAYRNQWLKDQILSPEEPKQVPEFYKATHNIFKRFYRWPLNCLENVLVPIIGAPRASVLRWMMGKTGISIAITYWMWYNLKYNGNNWEKKGGWRVLVSRKAIVPGDKNYPFVSDRTVGADYASRGFKEVTLNL